MPERSVYTNKQARYMALRTINKWLSLLDRGDPIEPAFLSNQFMTDKDKKKIRKEMEKIRYQLVDREIKLQQEIFDGTNS